MRFAIWGSAVIFLLLSVIDKIATSEPPSWWTVCVAFAAGVGALQLLHVLSEEKQHDQ
jgi:hypothetical protein